MIDRARHRLAIEGLLRRHPVVAVLGARQVGKSSLAGDIARRFGGSAQRFDLEDPADVARLADPSLALSGLRGLVVLDEIQRKPDLFPVLRVLADRPKRPARFLILGSASPDLIRRSSETLAGRIAHYELPAFSLDETGSDRLERLWLRGGYPRSFLAASGATSAEWRRDFVQTFLERHIPQIGISIPAATLRRFWTMLAHWHGQLWNASELGRAFGVADTTVRNYLDLLTGTYVVRQLLPWHENLRKRQVKAPKIYLADSGLLHTLLGIESQSDLDGHPKVGASWEGFAMGELIQRLGARREECYFWATHAQAELDLMVVRGRRRLGFEFKRTVAPHLTPSMRIAMSDLRLDSIAVVHAGRESFPLAPRVRAVALSRLLVDFKPMNA